MGATPSNGAVVIPLNFANSIPTPAGPAPWATVTFEDIAPNTVRLTLDPANLSNDESITNLFFNIANVANPGTFTYKFTDVGMPNVDYVPPIAPGMIGVPAAFSLSYDSNNQNAGPFHDFDFMLELPPPIVGNSDAWVQAGDKVVLEITLAGLTAANFESATDGDGLFAAAHIQRLANDESVWITTSIPETGSSISIASIISAGLFLRARRRR